MTEMRLRLRPLASKSGKTLLIGSIVVWLYKFLFIHTQRHYTRIKLKLIKKKRIEHSTSPLSSQQTLVSDYKI